jgi:hypothetical protein
MFHFIYCFHSLKVEVCTLHDSQVKFFTAHKIMDAPATVRRTPDDRNAFKVKNEAYGRFEYMVKHA